ncbi:MAG: hypothetical protein ACYSR4_03290 [Planctomycetota bacterium]|jgi:alpha-N-arabinofuranosidase
MLTLRSLGIGVLSIAILGGISYRAVAVDEPSVEKATLTIEASKTGAPISEYIYGQFIEHLGRCIYGGIWAEMLEDRKFYYPVPADGPIWKEHEGAGVLRASPWQVIGRKDAIKMIRENSYVGAHTPKVAVGGGIVQDGLGLRKGREYVGYVWLKPANGKSTVRVSLCWGEGADERQSETIAIAGDQYAKSPLHFRAVANTDNAKLRVEVTDRGPCFVGTVSLMPADNIKGMRADTIKLLKELNAPLYRWPGVARRCR